MAASPRGLPDLSRYGVDSVVYHSIPISVHPPPLLNRETSVHSTDAPGPQNSPHGTSTEQNTQVTHQPPIHLTNKSCSDNSTAREHNPLKRSFHVAMPKRATATSVADESAEEPGGELERRKAAAQARRRLIFVHYKGRPGIPRSASKRSPMSPTAGMRSNLLTGRKSPENTLDFELSGDDTNKQLPCKKQSQKASFLSVDETENRKVYKKQMSRSTSPILVHCSGEVVSDHCKQEPPPPKTSESLPMPLSKTPVMPNAINERVNMSDEDSSNSTPAILVQCSGETVSHNCKQVKTNPCMVLTKGEDKSYTRGIKAQEGNISKSEVLSQTHVMKGEKGCMPHSQVMSDTRKSRVVKSSGNKHQIQSDAQRRADATKQRLLKFKTRDQKTGTSKPDIRKRDRSPRVQTTQKSTDNESHELSDRKIPDSPSGVLIGTSTSSLAKVDQRQDQDNSQANTMVDRSVMTSPIKRKSSFVGGRSRPIRSKRGKRRVSSHKKVVKKDAATQHEEPPPTKIVTSTYDGVSFLSRQTRPKLETISDQNRRYAQLQRRSPFIVSTALTETNTPYKPSAEPWKSKISPLRGTRASPHTGESKSPYPLNIKPSVAGQIVIEETNNLNKHSGTQLRNPEGSRQMVSGNIPANAPFWEEGNTALPRSRVFPHQGGGKGTLHPTQQIQMSQSATNTGGGILPKIVTKWKSRDLSPSVAPPGHLKRRSEVVKMESLERISEDPESNVPSKEVVLLKKGCESMAASSSSPRITATSVTTLSPQLSSPARATASASVARDVARSVAHRRSDARARPGRHRDTDWRGEVNNRQDHLSNMNRTGNSAYANVGADFKGAIESKTVKSATQKGVCQVTGILKGSSVSNNVGNAPNLLQINPISLPPLIEKQCLSLSSVTGKTGPLPTTQTMRKEKRLGSSSKPSSQLITIHSRERTSSSRKLKRRPLSSHLIIKKARKQKMEEKVVTEKDYAAYKRRSDKAKKKSSTHTLSGRDPETIKHITPQGRSTASFVVDGASYIRRNDVSKSKCLQSMKRLESHEMSTSDLSREGYNASSSTMPCLTNVAAEYGMQNYRSPQAHSKIDQYAHFSKRGQPVQTVLHAQIHQPAQYNVHSLGVSQRSQFSNFSQNTQYAESPQRMQFTQNPQYPIEFNNSRQRLQYTQSSQPFQSTEPFQSPEHAQSSQYVQPSHASQPFQPPPSRHYIHLPQDIHCARQSYVQPGEYSQYAQYNVPSQAIPSAAQYPVDTRETNSLRRTVSYGSRALHSNAARSSSSRSKYVTEEPNREKVERARVSMSAEASRRDMKHSTLGFYNSQGGEFRKGSEVRRANYPPLLSSPVSSIAPSVVSSSTLAGAPGKRKNELRKPSRSDDASRPIWSRGTRTKAPEQRGKLYSHQIRNKRLIVSPVKRRMIHYNGRIIGSRHSQLRGSHKSGKKGGARPSSRHSAETEKSSADKSLRQYRSSGDSEKSVQGSSLAENRQSPKLNPTGPEWKVGQTMGPFVRSTKFIQPGRIVPVPHQVQIVGTPPPDLASFVDDTYGQSSMKMETGTNASHEVALSSSKYIENSARRHAHGTMRGVMQTHGINSSNMETSTAECTQSYPDIQMIPPNDHVNQSDRYNISPNFIPTPRQPSAVAINSLHEASGRYTENMSVAPPPLLPHIHVQYTAGGSISPAGPTPASGTVEGEQRTDEKASPKHPADMYLQISWNDAQCGPGSQEEKGSSPVESSDSTRASALVPASSLVPASPQSPRKESPATSQLNPRNPTTLATNRAFPSAAPWHLARRRLITQSAGPTTVNPPVTTKRSTPNIGTTGTSPGPSPKEGPHLVVLPTQIHKRGPASPAAVPCMSRQQNQQIRKGTQDVPEKIGKDSVNPVQRTSAIDKAHRLMTILTPKNTKLTPGPSRKGRPPMKSFVSSQQIPGQNRRKVQPSMLTKNLLPQMVEASVQTPQIVTPIEIITQGQKVAPGKTEACVQTPLLMQWGRCITSPFIQKQLEIADEATESRKSSPKQALTKQGYKWSVLAPKLAEAHSLKAAPVWLPNLVQQIRGYASTYMEKQKNEPPPTSQIPRRTNSPKAPKQQPVGANSSVMSTLDDSSPAQALDHKVESSPGPVKSITGEENTKSVQISAEVERKKEAQSDEPVLKSKVTILPKVNKLVAPISDGNKPRPSVQSGQANAEIRKIYQSPYKARPFIPTSKKTGSLKHTIGKTSRAPSGSPSKKCVHIPMKPSAKGNKTLSTIVIRGPDHPFTEKPGINTIKKQLKTNPTGLRKVFSKNWQKNSGRSRQLDKPKRASEPRGQSSGAARTAGTKHPVSQQRQNDGHVTKPSSSFKPAISIVPVGQPDFGPKVMVSDDVSREWKVATGLNMRVERMPRSHSTGPFHPKLKPDANKYSPFMSQPDLNKPPLTSIPPK